MKRTNPTNDQQRYFVSQAPLLLSVELTRCSTIMFIAFEIIGATQLRRVSLISVGVMGIWALSAPLVAMIECGSVKPGKWMCAGEVSTEIALSRAQTLTTEAGAAATHDPVDRRLVGSLADSVDGRRRLDPPTFLGKQAQGGDCLFMQAVVSHNTRRGTTERSSQVTGLWAAESAATLLTSNTYIMADLP